MENVKGGRENPMRKNKNREVIKLKYYSFRSHILSYLRLHIPREIPALRNEHREYAFHRASLVPQNPLKSEAKLKLALQDHYNWLVPMNNYCSFFFSWNHELFLIHPCSCLKFSPRLGETMVHPEKWERETHGWKEYPRWLPYLYVSWSPRTTQVGRGLKRSSDPTSHGKKKKKKESGWDYLASCPIAY